MTMTGAVVSKVRRSKKLYPAAGVLLAGLLLSACYGWSTQYSSSTAEFIGISCASTSDCVAVSGVQGSTPSAPTIVTTTNGGSTWSNPSGGTDQNLITVSCPDSTHCMAGGNNLVNGQEVGGIWVTSNPQGTWTLTPNLAGVNTVLALSCANDSDCFALVEGNFAGGGQALIQTVNGGGSWSFVLSGYNTMNLVALSCPAATVCYLVGENEAQFAEVLSTTNLDTWHTTDLSSTEFVSAISCPTTTSCMVAGNVGAFSTSNGSTWVNDSSAFNADTGSALGQTFGVSCVSAADCTVVGAPATGTYGQSVVATNDGGTTWHIEALGSSADLFGVSCASATTCWATSQSSIVATTNGGVASPQLNSLSPTSGPAGTTVTISGAGLNSTPSVDFGSVAATNVTVVSGSEITAVAPTPMATGTVDVTVHTSLGTSPYVIGDQFTYTG